MKKKRNTLQWKEIKKAFFPGKEFAYRYRHVGYSHPSVPVPWIPIVEDAIVKIEREMWPKWMPMWSKRLIHYLATDNSVVRIKYWWAHKIERKLRKGMLTQIKDKYATLRMYGYHTKEMQEIIEQAQKKCSETCEQCGSKENVEIRGESWVRNLCNKCSKE